MRTKCEVNVRVGSTITTAQNIIFWYAQNVTNKSTKWIRHEYCNVEVVYFLPDMATRAAVIEFYSTSSNAISGLFIFFFILIFIIGNGFVVPSGRYLRLFWRSRHPAFTYISINLLVRIHPPVPRWLFPVYKYYNIAFQFYANTSIIYFAGHFVKIHPVYAYTLSSQGRQRRGDNFSPIPWQFLGGPLKISDGMLCVGWIIVPCLLGLLGVIHINQIYAISSIQLN